MSIDQVTLSKLETFEKFLHGYLNDVRYLILQNGCDSFCN